MKSLNIKFSKTERSNYEASVESGTTLGSKSPSCSGFQQQMSFKFPSMNSNHMELCLEKHVGKMNC